MASTVRSTLNCRPMALAASSLVPRLGALAASSVRSSWMLAPRPVRAVVGAPMVVRTMASSAALQEQIKARNADQSVVVYSKTYCPYCSEVKGLFMKLEVAFDVVELDELADGSDVQAALSEVTGRRTVPQVFVGGKLIGGCDDTMAAYSSGKLKEAFAAAGVSAKI